MDNETLTAQALASDPSLNAFFLQRLASLVALHAIALPKERVVLAAAAFSTFLDCLDLGLETPARALLGELRFEEAALVA